MKGRHPSLLAAAGGMVEFRHLPGASDGPTLVLLHEGLGCVDLWRDFPDRLAARTGCAVFLYSRRGYGRSDPRPRPWALDYMQREARRDLPAVLDAAGIETCVLVGHSDGASIALVYAGEAEDQRVRGVVVFAPHVFVEEAGVANIRHARDAYCDGNLRARLARYHGDNVDCAFYGWCDSWLHPDFANWNIESCLPGITVPVLQIQGADDQYGSGAQLARVAAGVRGPVATHVLGACRHSPQFEQPEETLRLVGEFVAGLGTGPG